MDQFPIAGVVHGRFRVTGLDVDNTRLFERADVDAGTVVLFVRGVHQDLNVGLNSVPGGAQANTPCSGHLTIFAQHQRCGASPERLQGEGRPLTK